MNDYLINDLKRLGASETTAALSAQVFMEICEVKRYWDPSYEFNLSLEKVVIKAKKKPLGEFSIFIPIPSYEELSFMKLQHILSLSQSNSIFLAIIHPDSTCVYYMISDGLVEPKEVTAKHLRVNKQEKLDNELRRHSAVIKQAALLGIPLTIAKDKDKQSEDKEESSRVSEALNISVSTVTRIQNHLEGNNNLLRSPGKRRHRKKPKTSDLTDSNKADIRDTIYRMYSEKKHITLTSLNDELKQKSIISISRSSLHRLLPALGFKYMKDDNRRFLIEKTSIALQRTRFLRKYVENFIHLSK